MYVCYVTEGKSSNAFKCWDFEYMIADKLQYFTTPQYTQRILYTQTLLVIDIKVRSKIIYALLWLITSYGLKIKFSYHHINLWIIKNNAEKFRTKCENNSIECKSIFL